MREPLDPALRLRRLILAALADPAALPGWSAGDLDLVLRGLRRVRLLGRIAHRLYAGGPPAGLPPAARDQLDSALAMVEARERLARWELDRLGRALADGALGPVVLMKGCAYLLARLPNAPGRLFADVDLLLAEDRLGAAERHLLQQGWIGAPLTPYDERYYRRWTHELPPLSHPEREVEVDLHHNVLMRTARLSPDARLLLSGARPVAGTRFSVLGPVDMTLHAMTHLLYGGEMDDALRELVDVNDLLRHFGATEPGFWPGFWPRAKALDLARPAYYGLRYAGRLLGAPVPAEVLAESQAAAPAAPLVAAMDRLVPRALFPPHPDRPDSATAAARMLLYLRSHWVRMPPLLLARHLAYKAYLRYLAKGSASTASG